MNLIEGSQFAGYTVQALIGSGGMGEVYLVRHPRLPRPEALKLLSRELSSDEQFRQRFVREAELAAQLHHPHIVGVHDRGEHNGQLWISMDYISGKDAARLLAERVTLSPDEVARLVDSVASALDYAHAQGMLHRDVKPANILLSTDENPQRVFLTDFGIGRELADPGTLTATNLTVGTVPYAAPEQLMGADVDGRADQYGLAATAFHLLTGRTLFEHSNPLAVISAHLSTRAPRVSDIRPDLAALDAPFVRALSKDPAERYPACLEFASELRRSIANAASASTMWGHPRPPIVAGAAGRPSQPSTHAAQLNKNTQESPGIAPAIPYPPTNPRLETPTRRWWLVIGASAAAAALVASGVWFVGHKGSSTTAGGNDANTAEISPKGSEGRQVEGRQVELFTKQDLEPVGLAVHRDGTVYVGDPANNRILKLPAGAETPIEIPAESAIRSTGINLNLALDSRGNLYVSGEGGAMKIDAGSTTLTPLSIPQTGVVSIAVDSQENIYASYGGISAGGVEKLLKLAPGSSNPVELPLGETLDPNGCMYPSDLAVDKDDNLYAICSGSSSVVVFASGSGMRVKHLTISGLSTPLDIAIGERGAIYVSEGIRQNGLGTAQVSRFSAESRCTGDRCTFAWGRSVLPFEGLDFAKDVAVDEEYVYVIDYQGNPPDVDGRVLKLKRP